LPKAIVASPTEVLRFVERNNIFGTGIGYVDVHLLVATTLSSDLRLWTHGKRLRTVAEKLTLSAATLD
jgi:hypothetical protein